MPDFFPVECSILSSAALIKRVLPPYPIPAPLQCQLLHYDDSDIYLVLSRAARFILPAWSHG